MSQVSHGHTLQHATTPICTCEVRHPLGIPKDHFFFLHSVGKGFIGSLQQTTAVVVKIY